MEVEDITDILKDVYEGEISAEEAKEDIELASPLQLALAEVELLDDDLDESALKEFREVYSEIIEEKTEETLKKVDEDHPIHRLISEHVEIGKFVDELYSFSEKLQNQENRIIRKKKLENIENNIKEIKKHEKSEEEILFPRLEEEGFYGRVNIMKNEHEEIDDLMDELSSLSEDLVENKDEFVEKTEILNYTLEFHSFMENNFLYLVALEELDDWEAMYEQFEEKSFSDIRSMVKA